MMIDIIMKTISKILAMFMFAVSAFSLVFCSSDDNEELQDPNKVKVRFVYTLDTSNSGTMSRATTNEEVFNEFYEKIKSGELVAPTYTLTLTEVNTGVVYTFNGSWGNHDLITLNTGTYRVVGTSTADGDNIQEKCSFTFDEQIEISATSNVITLHANYDCFLLIFNNSQIGSLENYNGTTLSSFFNFNNYKYTFVNDKLYNDAKKSNAYILGKYTDNAEFKVFTGNLNFEKGKYYVYNSVSNGFDVPPMENGVVSKFEYPGIYFTNETLNYSFGITPVEIKRYTLKAPVEIKAGLSKVKRSIGYVINPKLTTAVEGVHYELGEAIIEPASINGYIPITIFRENLGGNYSEGYERYQICLELVDNDCFSPIPDAVQQLVVGFSNAIEQPGWYTPHGNKKWPEAFGSWHPFTFIKIIEYFHELENILPETYEKIVNDFGENLDNIPYGDYNAYDVIFRKYIIQPLYNYINDPYNREFILSVFPDYPFDVPDPYAAYNTLIN